MNEIFLRLYTGMDCYTHSRSYGFQRRLPLRKSSNMYQRLHDKYSTNDNRSPHRILTESLRLVMVFMTYIHVVTVMLIVYVCFYILHTHSA